MGQYWYNRSKEDNESSNIKNPSYFITDLPNHGTILINQVQCHICFSIARNQGVCKCGNVAVYGNTDELGRVVKDKSKYSECNLIEYRTAL